MNKNGALFAIALLGPLRMTSAATIKHVVVVIDENTSYASAYNATNLPYMTNLIKTQGALATNYYADTHPSIGNYMDLMTGKVLTNDDSRTPANFPVSQDNIVRELLANNLTWKAYCESIPSVGYIGGNSGEYAVRHCAFPYLTDVQNNATQKNNLVPFTQFATDLANNQLPNFSFLVGNLCDDGHDCKIPGSLIPDNWLKPNLPALLNSPTFTQDTLLIFLWDESLDSDVAHGGGHIEWAVMGAGVKHGYQQTSTTVYQDESTLRFILKELGATTFPGGAATAPDMTEFLGNVTTPPAKPVISSFVATPASITTGAASTLSWSSTGSTSLTIDNGVGTVTGLTSKSVSPTVTTTYTLAATNSSGAVTATAKVTVTAGTPTKPVISSFVATPTSITTGGATTLSWNVSGSTSLAINNGVGVVTGLTSKVVSPTVTTTYMLTATNTIGTVIATAKVTVINAAAPILSDGSPAATLPLGTQTVAIILNTNVSATCKYDTDPNTSYSAMTHTMTNTDAGITHTAQVSGLMNGQTYTYYVRCANSQDPSMMNTTDYTIHFAVDSVVVGAAGVKVYPNPWRADKDGSYPMITFAGLTAGTTLKIFTASGHKAKEIQTDGPTVTWDLTNSNGNKIASGIYLYLITDNNGDKLKGKLAIIR